MKATKKILKIDSNGSLVEYNDRLRIFESVSRSWNWSDIAKGHVRESKKNYNAKP